MNVSLTPELELFVKEKVRAGHYQTADEVINSALSVLQQQETLSAEDVADLREEIALGIGQLEQGQSAPWNAAALKDKLRKPSDGY